MSKTDIITKIEQIKELEALIDEAQAEADTLRDTIKAEMRDADGNPLHRHVKGALAAARQGDLANPFKESSGSQFYLVQDPEHCVHLDGEYTVFGETIAGLHVIDKIAAQPTDHLDRPLKEIRILSIRPNKELNNN